MLENFNEFKDWVLFIKPDYLHFYIGEWLDKYIGVPAEIFVEDLWCC